MPPRRPTDFPSELRLADLATFLAVHRCGSITGAARELSVTPSQVSKAVARLEKELRLTLLSRSVRGTLLSDAAQRMLPELQQVMAGLRRMYRAEGGAQRTLTMAAPSYLCALFLPVIAASQPQLLLRGLELPPAMLRAHAAENFFDLSLIEREARLPSSWQSVSIGELHKGLFARPQLAARLGTPPVAPELVAELPFVSPVYSVNGQFVPVDDGCPIDPAKRRMGCQAQTIAVALELAMARDELVFGPVIAARRHLDAGWLVAVPVSGWAVAEPLHFAWSADRLLASEQRAIAAALGEALGRLGVPPGKRSFPSAGGRRGGRRAIVVEE